MSVEMVRQLALQGGAGATGWVRGDCPFCVSRTGKVDRRRSLGVNVFTGFYVCHKCEVKGKIEIDSDFETPSFLQETKTQIEQPEGFVPLWCDPGLTAEVFSEARGYLRGRGYGRKSWADIKLGAVSSGYFANRIVIPIFKTKNRVTWSGWVARDWTGYAIRKYLYPVGMNRNETMFEAWRLFDDSDAPLMIVEGVFDALPYHGDAIAVLGKPSHGQIELMKQSKRTMIVVLDGDAWETGFALSQKLKLNSCKANYVKLPAGEDPASVDHEWLRDAVKNAAREL